MPASVRSAFEAAGGEVRAGARVVAILQRGDRVRGVELEDGTVLEAPLGRVGVRSTQRRSCDGCATPRRPRVLWCERWRAKPVEEGYESKIDAVITELPALPIREPAPLRAARRRGADASARRSSSPTTRRHRRRAPSDRSGPGGREADVLRQHPVGARPDHARRGGNHVLSLETLYTPYSLVGGWDGSEEPQRWLRALAFPGRATASSTSVERWRVMTPDAATSASSTCPAATRRRSAARRCRRCSAANPSSLGTRRRSRASTSPARPPSRAPACGGRRPQRRHRHPPRQ